MKFQTEDENDISWMRNPDNYPNVAEEVRRIKNAGKWDEFLMLHADEDGVVDADALYEYLWHEGGSALLEVGLHENEGTATIEDVLKAWEESNAPRKVSRVHAPGMRDDGKPTGIMLYDYGARTGHTQIDLEFEAVDADGEVESVTLDEEEVLDLVGFKANNNATEGAWTSTDDADAIFEMWRGE